MSENLSRQTFPDRIAVIITKVSQLDLYHVQLQKILREDPAFSADT